MAAKDERQQLVLRLIRSQSVRTQEELAEQLATNGVETSQVTLSRDLRELGIVKTANGYEEPHRIGADAASTAEDADKNLARVLGDFLQSVEVAANLVVVKTHPGGAGAVALAIDQADWPDIVGTLAGDDTIFAATRSAESAERVRRRLLSIGRA